MPPKSKITRDMIINAAYEIVKEAGIENMNARTISNRLGCSTQPVLYWFKTMEEIRAEVYKKADEYHTEYLMSNLRTSSDPMFALGSNYIRFGYEQKHLFRFLFQSDCLKGQMQSLFDDEALLPILAVMQAQMQIDKETAKKIFATIYYPVHGMASLLANNSMEYNEAECKEVLMTIRMGVLKEIGGKN